MEEITLVKTCDACPEQYDAFIGKKQVGYLRLRHGLFTVDYPDVGGRCIFQATTEGDGIFEENEREDYLTMAKVAIQLAIKWDENEANRQLLNDQPQGG